MDHILFIHPLIDIYLYLGAIINNAAINMVYNFLCEYVFNILGSIPSSGMAE